MIKATSITTMHGLERTIERCNMKTSAALKSIERAIRFGGRADNYKSWERNYLRSESHDGCTAIAYNNFCYIISNEGRCVTVHELPSWFGVKKHFNGKERIRNYRKYCKTNSYYEDCLQ